MYQPLESRLGLAPIERPTHSDALRGYALNKSTALLSASSFDGQAEKNTFSILFFIYFFIVKKSCPFFFSLFPLSL